MAEFTLDEIIQATGGVSGTKGKIKFTTVCTDTRRITEGCLFVALQGEKFDGHGFLREAADKGAAGAIVSSGKAADGMVCIEVPDTLAAYQQLARFHRRRFAIPVVAVTGSSGKTTTKEMIAAVLETKFKVLKTEKNFNNEIGLPQTLLALTAEHEACVVEMGMRGFGQIQALAAIAEPTIGVLTNVGTSHMELLGSQENIAKAKGELVEAIDKEGTVILNEDDHFVKGMARLTSGKVLSYGIDHNATVTGSHLRCKKDGIKFTCKCYDEVFDVFLPMLGVHNVYDALAAIAVGRVLGLVSLQIKRALGSFAGIPMRQEIMPFRDFVLLNDAYNANPSSMIESARALGQLEGKRKIAMVGDMLELGDYSEEGHRQVGRVLGEEGYEIVYTLGEQAAYIGAAAREAGVPEVYSCTSQADAAEKYLKASRKGDVILLKGSRGMQMELIAAELRERTE